MIRGTSQKGFEFKDFLAVNRLGWVPSIFLDAHIYIYIMYIYILKFCISNSNHLVHVNILPSGKLTQILKITNLQVIYPLKMVVFSYLCWLTREYNLTVVHVHVKATRVPRTETLDLTCHWKQPRSFTFVAVCLHSYGHGCQLQLLFLGDYTFHGDLVLTNGTHHVRFKQLFSETQCSKLGAVTATCWQVPFARI